MSDEQKYIKIRDDHQPLYFISDESEYKILEDATTNHVSWLPDNVDSCSLSDLRKGIEPWLASLFQSEHLSVLIGSGLTTALQHVSDATSPNGMNVPELTSVHKDRIIAAADNSARSANRGGANIEDYIRVINELLIGLKILDREVETVELRHELDNILGAFIAGISEGERGIVEADESKGEEAFHLLVSFLMSFASRTETRDRLNIFTTNYDRLIEAGAEIAGLHLIDRFVGNSKYRSHLAQICEDIYDH